MIMIVDRLIVEKGPRTQETIGPLRYKESEGSGGRQSWGDGESGWVVEN